MVTDDFLTQTGCGDVGVDLCGDYRLMTQHGLDGPEVSSPIEQRCGETVTESVGTHRLFDASHGH